MVEGWMMELELEKEKGEKVRLILDPHRAGIARSVLKSLLEIGI